MKQGRLILLLTLAILTIAGNAGAQDTLRGSKGRALYRLSLSQALGLARQNNIQVKNALIQYQLQEQTNRGITSAAYPQINGTISTTYYPNIPVQVIPDFISPQFIRTLDEYDIPDGNGNPIKFDSTAPTRFIPLTFSTKWNASAGVTLSQILFDGQVFVGLQARQASLDYQRKNIEVTEESIKENVYKVYYQLVVSKIQIEQIEANIERAEDLLRETKAFYENGFREKLDMDRAQVQLSNLQTTKLSTQRSIENGYLGLKFLLGLPHVDSIILTDEITEDKIKSGVLDDRIFEYSDRKDFQLLETQDLLRQYNIKRYKFAYLPQINLSSSYLKQAYREKFDFFGKGDWFTNWSIGLNINVPIFDGFQRAANVRTAQLEKRQVELELDNLKLSIDNEVAQAQNTFRAAILTLDNQTQNIELARSVYDATRKKYEAGLATSTEITTSQTELRLAETNYVNAMYDAVVAKIDYLSAIGKLP